MQDDLGNMIECESEHFFVAVKLLFFARNENVGNKMRHNARVGLCWC